MLCESWLLWIFIAREMILQENQAYNAIKMNIYLYNVTL